MFSLYEHFVFILNFSVSSFLDLVEKDCQANFKAESCPCIKFAFPSNRPCCTTKTSSFQDVPPALFLFISCAFIFHADGSDVS